MQMHSAFGATLSDMQPGGRQLSCLKVVRPRRPLIALLEFAAVDPDHENVAIVTSLGSGFVHHIASGRTKAIPLRPRRRKTCLSATNNLLAACHDTTIDLYRMDQRSGMAELRRIQPNSKSNPRVCSLSANGQFFGLVTENTKTASSSAKVFDSSDWDTPLQTWVDKNYDGINFSPDGSTTFLYGEQQLVAFDTVSGSQRAALSIDPRREHSHFLGFVSDLSTDHVAIVDGRSLQLWNVNCPDEPAKTLPHYRPPISLYSIGACAISRDGGRVVAAVSNHNFGIWDTVTCSRIATMVGHEFRLYACAIASDGNSIVTVADNFEIRTWKMPRDSQAHQIVDVEQAQSVVDDEDQALSDASDSVSDLDEPKIQKIATHLQSKQHIEHTQSLIRPALTATVLEHAFAKILSDPALLDHSFITDHISANNVNTASDLLAGHNIILFAIRAGVITHNDIHTIGDTRWYLQDNLYLPATKLTDENGDLLDAIFLHAESLGIVQDGHKFKMAREFRLDMENDLQSIGHAVTDMAQRLCHLEERVDALETDVRNMNEMVNKLASNEQNLQDAVMRLSEALRQLQESLHKGDKRIRYAAVAKCLLSFIPLVGHAVGEASYTVAELLMEFNKRDVRRIRMERMKSIATQITQVDLSNMQVARYAFSETTQKKLEPTAREAVLDSVQKSGFKSVDEVESVLVQLVSEITVEDEPIALLDIGSSAWLSEGSSATTGDGPSQTSDLPEDKARKHFEYVCADKRDRELDFEGAKVELNYVLDRCNGLHKIDEEDFENMFFDITDPDVETVNEALFLEMFRRVQEDQMQQCAMEAVLEETREKFDIRAGSKAYVNVRLAARLLNNMSCEMVKRGMLNEGLCTDVSAAARAMSGMGFEKGNIGRDEFVTVVEHLLSRNSGEGRSILSCTYDSEKIAKIAGNFNL